MLIHRTPYYLLLSPEKKKITLNIHATAILQYYCLPLSPWERVNFFPQELSIVQDISFGAKHRYTMLWWVNKHTIGCCSVLWIVTLQAHIIMSLEIPWKASIKLNKLKQTHKCDKCTYIYHTRQKLHCTAFILKGHSFTFCTDCTGATLSYSLQNESLYFMLRFVICFLLIHPVWFTPTACVLKIIYIQKLIISYSVHVV